MGNPSHLTRGAWIEKSMSSTSLPAVSVAPHTRCVDWKFFCDCYTCHFYCRTSHEVRGLKKTSRRILMLMICRTSHEVRGLKNEAAKVRIVILHVAPHTRCVDWKNPSAFCCSFECCRTSHEVRGLKILHRVLRVKKRRRTSHEVRGLKIYNELSCTICTGRTSHEVRGLKRLR